MKRLILSLQEYHLKYYQEKIYIQTDTDVYFAGDVVWLSTRLLDAQDHTYSKLSRVVHVKLLDDQGNERSHKKVLTTDGVGHADILLEDTLSGGTYSLLAYTEWMKNFSQDMFFSKEIFVVNESSEKIDAVKWNDREIDVTFFPEGGTLIESMTNKVGFKVIDSRGLGVDVQGYVLNDQMDTIAKINTYKLGMGSFFLWPKKKEAYELHLEWQGEVRRYKLPEAEKNGANLRVNLDSMNDVSVAINLTKELVKNLQKIILISHCRGQVSFAAEGKAVSKSTIFIPRAKMQAGINHITIFDQDGLPIAERLLFIPPEVDSDLVISQQSNIYGKRTEVELSVSSAMTEDANFTISVHDRPPVGSDNIVNYLLLDSDLKGQVEEPKFYLNDTDSARIAADHLMLTQGWVRFNWKQIGDSTAMNLSYSAENQGIVFRGKLINRKTNLPVTDTLFMLSQLYGRANFLFDRAKADGEFTFHLHEFYDKKKLFVNMFGQDSLNQYQLWSSESYDPFEFTHIPFQDRVSTPWTSYLESKKTDDLVIDNYRLYAPSTSLNWRTPQAYESFKVGQKLASPEYVVKPEEYVELNDLKELLWELLPSTSMRKVDGENKIFVYKYQQLPNKIRREIPDFNDKPATLFLNGIPIFNEEFVFNNLEYDNIEKVEVFIGQYDYSDHRFYGFVSITTKDIFNEKSILNGTSNAVDYYGISLTREYYSPKYEMNNTYTNRIPDLRHLLYWQPSVSIKKKDSLSMVFYTSDVQKDFFVNIEGISQSGIPFQVTSKLTVASNQP
ncbi:hypothetical protein [Reichenbachiella faecimaris]|uniref:hypothetical protein n=1 Tax=Reichenbachiella faecimaris TaxID=692418 RepID=UPI00111C88D3|nr:hypothetical protein [Reichenbachiella faecimaris]